MTQKRLIEILEKRTGLKVEVNGPKVKIGQVTIDYPAAREMVAR